MNIDRICKKYKIKNYSINPDGSIDVDGTVDLSGKNLKKLPLKFNNVIGFFFCTHNQLISLEGSPKMVSNEFWCGFNKLITLKGAPKTVDGGFSCVNNRLTSLEGSPIMVGGNFMCDRNRLTTLEGAPKTVNGDFWCDRNQLLPYELRYILFSDISGDFISGMGKINETMNAYFSLSEQEKKREIFKILAELKSML